MPLATVRDAVQLSFDTYGSREDPLVLLIPGAGAPADFWPEDFCRELSASGRYIVRYSHRDTGESTHFDEPYPIDELLQDMKSFLAFLGKREAHLVGHSMGGYLAQMAMCSFREYIASVTSISAGSTVSPDVAAELGMSSVSEETWQVLMKNEPTGDLEKDLPGWLESWRFLNGTRAFSEDLATRYTRDLYTGDPRNAQVAVNHVHAMSTVPDSLVGELNRADCPFLVIHGTEDPLVPLDHGEASARLVPGSSMFHIEGAGHMFFNDHTWREICEAVTSHTRPST